MTAPAEEALARAIAFLEARQHADGEIPIEIYWPGFSRPDPSLFPTALAAHCLSFDPRAARLRERALDLLEKEMLRGGFWKHRHHSNSQFHEMPPDVDDTACASASLRAGGRAVPDNTRRLLANRNRQGLFRTWLIREELLRRPIRTIRFFSITTSRPFDLDAVVNANVLFYLGRRPETEAALAYVLRVLEEDVEATCDKWYDRAPIARYFFSRAFRAVAPEYGELVATRAAAERPDNALDLALTASTLLDWDREPDLEPLLAAQLPSGGWPRAALYTGGRPRLPGGGWFAPLDPMAPLFGSEALTTAFCVEALSRALRRRATGARTAAAAG